MNRKYEFDPERSSVPPAYWRWFFGSSKFLDLRRHGLAFSGENFLNWEKRFPPRGNNFVIVEAWFVVSSRVTDATYLYVVKKRAADVVYQYGTSRSSVTERLWDKFGGPRLMGMSKRERAQAFREEEKRRDSEELRERLERGGAGETWGSIVESMPGYIADMAKKISTKTTEGSPGGDVQAFVGWSVYLPPAWKDFVRRSYPRKTKKRRRKQ